MVDPEQPLHVAADLDQDVAGLILGMDSDLGDDPAQGLDRGRVERAVAPLQRGRKIGDGAGIGGRRLRVQLHHIILARGDLELAPRDFCGLLGLQHLGVGFLALDQSARHHVDQPHVAGPAVRRGPLQPCPVAARRLRQATALLGIDPDELLQIVWTVELRPKAMEDRLLDLLEPIARLVLATAALVRRAAPDPDRLAATVVDAHAASAAGAADQA
ncbi:hypothetical protein [Cereibacter sphaeroides]|uniref:hypothetical protein n=1 Tax=Cereibacter sphaeroides TaxID=1063 RepID=UPI001F3E02DB|nr:hypothetical protein [Cereibacter sphaeroides]